jgi:hypothetical protein
VVIVVLGGDVGGGLLAKLDVDADGAQVPVAGFGLQLRGAAAELGQVHQPAVTQLVQGVANAVRIVGDRGLLETETVGQRRVGSHDRVP